LHYFIEKLSMQLR